MSILFGGGPKQKPQYSGIQLQTSSSVIPITQGWGFNRVAPNLFWYDDFKSHKQKVKAGKGMPKATTYTYSASIMMALGWGEVLGVDRVFRDNEKQTSYSALGLSLFTGTDPQAPWGYLTSAHADEAYNYPGIAYLAAANYDLGNSATLPQHSFEVRWPFYDSAGLGTGDALPSDIIDDFIRNPKTGCIGPTNIIDESTLFSGPNATTTGDAAYETYCRVMGFGLSPLLTDQEAAGEVIQRWMKLTNSEVVWTGYSLKFIPHGSYEITANGYHYKPDTKTPVYTISTDNFIESGNDDPLSIQRTDPADAYNSLKLKFKDRGNEYNPKPAEWKDQGLIDQFGLRQASDMDASEICLKDMAGVVATLIGERQAYIRNKYTFTLGPEYVLIEPGDILTVPDPVLGEVEVLVTSVTENDDGDFELEADEHKASVTHISADTFIPQGADAKTLNSAVDPGDVNTPIVFEPPIALIEGTPQVWAAVSGGPNWGGCIVYASTDNVTYQAVGTIDTPARMGVLTSALASTALANPITTQTLQVNLSQSQGDLMSVSATDASEAHTLCWVDGEFLSFQDATLTSTYHYDLTTLYRGLYGTAKGTHALGSSFARLDESIFKFDLDQKYVGQTLYFKFQSFNIFGITYQDLADCTAYTYAPVGSAFVSPPGTPTSVLTVGGTLANIISWTAPSTGGTPTKYKIYAIHGSSGAFGAASLVGTVDAPQTSFTHAGLGISDTWRYFVVASNSGGDSAATSGANCTTASSGGGSTTLAGLTDVAITSPADSDRLVYDGTAGKWKNSPASSSGAAPSIRGTNKVLTSGSSMSITLPPGCQPGDLAILMGHHAWSVTGPAGWTNVDTSPGSNVQGFIFTKVLNSSDISTGTVTCTFSSSHNGDMAIVVMIGAPTIRQYSVERTAINGTSDSLTTASGPQIGDLAILYSGTRSNVSVGVSPGTVLQSGSSSDASMVLASYQILASGAVTGNFTYSSGGSGYYEVIIVLQGNGSVAVSKLDDLTDVDLTTPPTSGQTLVYDSTSSTFKAGTISGGGGGGTTTIAPGSLMTKAQAVAYDAQGVVENQYVPAQGLSASGSASSSNNLSVTFTANQAQTVKVSFFAILSRPSGLSRISLRNTAGTIIWPKFSDVNAYHTRVYAQPQGEGDGMMLSFEAEIAVTAGTYTWQIYNNDVSTNVTATYYDRQLTVEYLGGSATSGSLYDLAAGVPAASAFTTFNFGTGTTLSETTGKALVLKGTSASSGAGIQGVQKGVPSTPYRVAIFVQNAIIGNDSWAAMGWRDGTGKLQIILNNGQQLAVQAYNSPTSFNSEQFSQATNELGGQFWYGFRDDGTTVYFEISQDGVDFVTLYSVAKSSGFLGSSGYANIFFGIRQNDSSNSSLTVRCWDENGLTRTYPATTNVGIASGLFAVKKPPLDLSTWVNQGTSTKVVQTDGAITLAAALDTSDNVRGVCANLPATPWSYKIGWMPTLSGVNWQHVGVFLRESSSGKLILFGSYRESTVGNSSFFIANYNSPTSKNANVVVAAPPNPYFNQPVYLSIADDGTTRTASFGYEPNSQPFAAYSVSHSSFLVADQIGFYTNNFNSSNPAAITLFSWV